MSDGATCSTGGVRIFGPEGESELLYFPEGAEREELLASIDLDWRVDAEAIIDSNEIHDVYLVGESTPPGNEVDRVPRSIYCSLAVLAIGMVGFYGYRFVVNGETKGDKIFGGFGAGVTSLGVIGTGMRCLRKPPAPPSLPTNDEASLDAACDPDPWRRGEFHLEPESFWPLIPAAIMGAILWLSGGGSLGFQTTGFSLTANGTAGPEL